MTAADTRRRCRSCRRVLTDPVSLAYGRGPDCRRGHPTAPSPPAPRTPRPAGPVEVAPGQLAIPIQLTLT